MNTEKVTLIMVPEETLADILSTQQSILQQLKELNANGLTGVKWISPSEAMRMLNISSRSTLQMLRDTGAIRYSQPKRKIVLYDMGSILEYLEKHSQEPFK